MDRSAGGDGELVASYERQGLGRTGSSGQDGRPGQVPARGVR
ncbi:hypothetical protein ACNFR7_20600 [Streptomyces sp. RM1]